MEVIKKISPEWMLRIGLGSMYIYSGFDIFFHPTAWLWAIPKWLGAVISNFLALDLYLRMQGAGEFVMGILLLLWFVRGNLLKIIAGLSVIEMGAILLFTGIDPITFRDLGLLGASAALLVLAVNRSGEFHGESA